DAEAREVAARPGQAGDEASRDRVAYAEDDRDRRGCVFRCDCRDAALGHDHVDLAADEVGSQGGQPIIAVLRRAVFNRYVLSLDMAGVAEPETERGQTRCIRAGRADAEETDDRHRLLLRAEGARGSHHAAQEQHQLAPRHSMTSSAWASIVGGTVSPSSLAVLRLITS